MCDTCTNIKHTQHSLLTIYRNNSKTKKKKLEFRILRLQRDHNRSDRRSKFGRIEYAKKHYVVDMGILNFSQFERFWGSVAWKHNMHACIDACVHCIQH